MTFAPTGWTNKLAQKLGIISKFCSQINFQLNACRDIEVLSIFQFYFLCKIQSWLDWNFSADSILMHCMPHSLAVEKKKHLLLFHFLILRILRIWIIQFGENQRYLNVWIGFKENSFFLFAEDYWAWNRIRLGKPGWLNSIAFTNLYIVIIYFGTFQHIFTLSSLEWKSPFWHCPGFLFEQMLVNQSGKWQGGEVASFFVSKCWSARAWQRKWASLLCQWSLQCLIKKFHVNANVNITKYSNIKS